MASSLAAVGDGFDVMVLRRGGGGVPVINPYTWTVVAGGGANGVFDLVGISPEAAWVDYTVPAGTAANTTYAIILIPTGAAVGVSQTLTVNVFTAYTSAPLTGDITDNDSVGTLVTQVNSTTVNAAGNTTINGQYGTLVINAAGQYTYTAATNGLGLYHKEVFTYTVKDPSNATAQSTLTIYISPTNTPVVGSSSLLGPLSLAIGPEELAIVPSEEVVITAVTDHTGTLADQGHTSDAALTISGTLPAVLAEGKEVHVFRDGQDIGTASVEGTGWTFVDTNVTGGEHSYFAVVHDTASGLDGTPSNSFGIEASGVTLTGTAGADVLAGTDQADVIDGGSGGADVLEGHGGDDLLKVGSADFQSIDGGSGFDILQLTGNGIELNLDNVTGIEEIDLGIGGGNALTVHLQDLLDIPDATPKTLMVNGDNTDTVKLPVGDNFTHAVGDIQVQNGITYDVWHAGAGLDVATLLLEQSVHVQQVP
jgi:VCBS repeat-containing protein